MASGDEIDFIFNSINGNNIICLAFEKILSSFFKNILFQLMNSWAIHYIK